jgi:TRAP-type C4-dicarboxylate transport system permease small subunit
MPIIKILWKAEVAFITLAMGIMSIVTFGAVVSRFSFHYPLPWSEELVRYLFAWTSMVGSSVAVRAGAHIGINVVTDQLPEKLKKPVGVISMLCSMSFCVALFFIGWDQMMNQWGQLSAGMELNMAVVYACLPVGAILMLISLVAVLLQDFNLIKINTSGIEVKEVI